jgi:hypothetical protein
MDGALRIIVACGVLFLSAPSIPRALAAEDAGITARIKTAVTRSLCYDVYWGGGRFYRKGVPLPLKIKIEGTKFYAQLQDVGDLGKRSVSLYQIGLVRAESAVVTHNFERGLEKRFLDTPVISDVLTIPTDCTPRYDPPAPQKERMLQTVVSTLKKQLSSFVRAGVWKYPSGVRLTIADFNVDYPSTYILVEPPGHLYSVTLHNPQDYDSDLYERQGEYPFGEIRVRPHHRPLLAKIRKHGIVRKITLTP